MLYKSFANRLAKNPVKCGCHFYNPETIKPVLQGNPAASFILRKQPFKTSSANDAPLIEDGENLDPSKSNPQLEADPFIKYKRWEIHAYGGIEQLRFNDKIGRSTPYIHDVNDVLIQVHAASVNPIDVAMMKGYGASSINLLRRAHITTGPFGVPLPNLKSVFQKSSTIEFPLILGRDFSGVVVEKGHSVETLKVGDEVYGVVGVQRQGSHANYAVASADTVRKKPKKLNFVEAASIPYAGLTAWSAIKVTGGLTNLNNKKILVLGASGGVGTFAVQYLRAGGAHVVATCSVDAIPLVESLGAEFVIDYNDPDFRSHVKSQGVFDCILDFTGQRNHSEGKSIMKFLKPYKGQYIALTSPFLSNMDRWGLFAGSVKNATDLISHNLSSWKDSNAISKWAFFIPNGCAIDSFTRLIDSELIRPVVQTTYGLSQVPEAYKKVEEGHLRGKVVIDFTK